MAVTTIVALSAASRSVPRIGANTARRAGFFGRIFSRRNRQPTLFHRCLAVHIASAETLGALR